MIDLQKIKKEFEYKNSQYKKRIIICAGTACVANGSLKIKDQFNKILEKKEISVTIELNDENKQNITKSGCQGFCQMGPLVTILPDNILYTKVKVDDVKEIIEETIIKNRVIERLLYKNPKTNSSCKNSNEIDFYKKQNRLVLQKCGLIDPEDINEYIANDGYFEMKRCYQALTSENICNEILESGLRGRGGGGFLTGKKWQLALNQKSNVKYIICNGDEGDPGAFMDRSIMEGNPHSVIEGICIAAKAINATKGYLYIRTEYPLAITRMRKAVEDAYNYGFLGKDIFNSGINFDIEVMEGAGAFVCGEETALISSIEGKRGMPSPKPPFPVESGLWGKPTVINNVETLATVPLIFKIGAKNFKKIGTSTSTGTKTFAITGHIANTGLVEVPLGTTVREIVENIAGGVVSRNGSISLDNFKAIQIGGPSGGCLSKEHLDYPLDFDSLKKIGAMIGSGGLVVINKDSCMVNIAKYFMQFTQNESCGKCVLCREGTKQMLNILENITSGKANMSDLETLEELADAVKIGSLCGLGKSAPNPVLSTIKQFKDEYIAHIKDKKCPAKECTALVNISINKDLCKKCSLCLKKCPVSAITGNREEGFVIDTEKCIKCMACVSACKFNAIS